MIEFTAGDIVECIDATGALAESRIMPEPGHLYTVSSIRSVEGGHSVRLKELTPSCFQGGVCACGQCGWDAKRFRKIHRPRSSFLVELLEKSAPASV